MTTYTAAPATLRSTERRFFADVQAHLWIVSYWVENPATAQTDTVWVCSPKFADVFAVDATGKAVKGVGAEVLLTGATGDEGAFVATEIARRPRV